MSEPERQHQTPMPIAAAPENLLDYFSVNIGEAMDEVADRISNELNRLGIDAVPAVQALGDHSLWRARLVLGLAQRSATLSAGHLDVAVAIELLNIAFGTHLVATDDILRSHASLASHHQGHLILAGDYYLTRAAVTALRSEHLTTLQAIAAIMTAIPTGRIALLAGIDRPTDAVRRYRIGQTHLYHRVAANCFRASLSESGLIDRHADCATRLAAWTASAIPARRDWLARALGAPHAVWDLPMIIALRRLPVGDRVAALGDLTAGDPAAAHTRAMIAIQQTGAMESCGAWAQTCHEKACAILDEAFPDTAVAARLPSLQIGITRHVT